MGRNLDNSLVPGESVGPFELGVNIGDVRDKYDLYLDDYYSNITYVDDVRKLLIVVEDEVISSIICSKSCIYKGTNLIGLKIPACLELLGCKGDHPIDDTVEWDDFVQHYYEIEEMGVQVVVVNDVVKSVGVGEIFDDDGETTLHPFRITKPD